MKQGPFDTALIHYLHTQCHLSRAWIDQKGISPNYIYTFQGERQ